MLIAAFYLFSLTTLVALRWVDPPVTMVQVQRHIEAWVHHKPYSKRQQWTPLGRIAPDLQHAVVSAEDGRFFQHHGIDWKEVQKVVDQDVEDGHLGRGGSTITQQLVKNLFFTTNRSVVRKGVEFTLAPLAEWVLPKKRILELYLNVIEWGPGVYGADAASRSWYGIPAAQGKSRTGGSAGGGDPLPVATQACTDEFLQRGNSPPHGADGMVRSVGCGAGIIAGDSG